MLILVQKDTPSAPETEEGVQAEAEAQASKRPRIALLGFRDRGCKGGDKASS